MKMARTKQTLSKEQAVAKTIEPVKLEEATVAKKPVPALFFLTQSESITRSNLDTVKKQVEIVDNDKLYVIVKSSGGDAYTAVRIIKHIRTKYKEIIGVIPDYTYSAATLMLLGSKKILVSPEGYIGPIDKPLEHSESGESISALDVTQSFYNIATAVSTNAVEYYKEIRDRESMGDTISKRDALEIAWKSAINLACPIVEKIDPVLLQKSYRDLRIGLYCGLDLLTDSMITNRYDAYQIVSKLVNQFPSHGYAIFRDEMKKLGLVIENFENSADYSKIQELYKINMGGIMFYKDIYA